MSVSVEALQYLIAEKTLARKIISVRLPSPMNTSRILHSARKPSGLTAVRQPVYQSYRIDTTSFMQRSFAWPSAFCNSSEHETFFAWTFSHVDTDTTKLPLFLPSYHLASDPVRGARRGRVRRPALPGSSIAFAAGQFPPLQRPAGSGMLSKICQFSFLRWPSLLSVSAQRDKFGLDGQASGRC